MKLILFVSFGSALKLIVVLAILDAFISNLAAPAYFAITQDVVEPKLRATSLALGAEYIVLSGKSYDLKEIDFYADNTSVWLNQSQKKTGNLIIGNQVF